MSATASAAYHVETCVIGAGVIGLAVARALAMAGKEVLILERASRIGSGASMYFKYWEESAL
jgi:NADPH-dependent 2,4-dienoyl-CoA reductase/sulfur reductase-like enzyme